VSVGVDDVANGKTPALRLAKEKIHLRGGVDESGLTGFLIPDEISEHGHVAYLDLFQDHESTAPFL